MRGYYRHTKIIATVGPATESPGEARPAHPRRARCHPPQHGPWHRRVGHRAGAAHPRGLGRGAAARRGHDGREGTGNPHRRGGRADRSEGRASCSSSTPTGPRRRRARRRRQLSRLAARCAVGATVLRRQRPDPHGGPGQGRHPRPLPRHSRPASSGRAGISTCPAWMSTCRR